MKTLLIVDDDRIYARSVCNWLIKKGMNAKYVLSMRAAKEFISGRKADLVLCDLCLEDGDGVELLNWMNENGHICPFFIMTNFGKISNAVKAIKLGAKDYFCKPIQTEECFQKIQHFLSYHKNRQNKDTFIKGNSAKSIELQEYIKLVAPTDMPVLIIGASGTGKEFVARQIHSLSDRCNCPFVSVDCGAVPRDLAPSDFFGHIKGAFTGAIENKEGHFSMANTGTLFLDEIGNLSHQTQQLLLRVLQERKFRPIGGLKEIEVDIRLVTATNEDMVQAIAEGRFREDLFHRINEFPIRMPSLAERRTDIIILATCFLQSANKELKREIKGFNEEAEKKLEEYNWPGNIRELRAVVRRAVLLSNDDYITADGLDIKVTVASSGYALNNDSKERDMILEVLKTTGNNRKKAAKLLCISRSTFYEKLKRHGIE